MHMKKAIIRLMRGCLLLLAVTLCAGATGGQISDRSQTARPNVVWFVVDDIRNFHPLRPHLQPNA